MSTEVWFRNPDLYIRECVELGTFNIAWDRGYLVTKRIDAARHAELHIPASHDYRVLLVGDQGTAELRRGLTIKNPAAVYPTWDYEEDNIVTLEEMMATPVSEMDRYVDDMRIPPDERPIRGQEHRLVVANVPPAGAGPGRKFYRTLNEMQADYPECIVHVHGLYGYGTAFGLNFQSVDIDPRVTAQKGKVTLPVGREVTYERARSTPQWVTILGYSVKDLEVPRNRCMFNMRSAIWAGEHFKDQARFKTTGGHTPDTTSPTALVKSPTTSSSMSTGAKGTVGDKLVCDLCSLRSTCKYFRVGSVCAIPGTEPARLAQLMQSRDPDVIINGLGTIMAANADRLQRGITDEQSGLGAGDGPLDPEVSKLAKNLFDSGVQMAKLLAPGRFTVGAKTALVLPNGEALRGMSPQEVMAELVAHANAKGIPISSLTPDLIDKFVHGHGSVIDVPALEVGESDDGDYGLEDAD